jgi:biotin synthase
MCYAIPGKVFEIKEKIAVIDYFGEKRKVLNEFSDIKEGDYVYAQGGIIVKKIPKKEALEILNTWKDTFFALKKIDKNLSSKATFNNVSKSILEILERINLKKDLNKNDLLNLLNLENETDLKLLYQFANNIRQKELKNACCVHGIIEFSNFCKNNCFYCGIRRERKIKRYRMKEEEIIKIAKYAVKKYGFKALVLQSGEDFWYDEKKLIKIVKEIRKLHVLIFLSIGVREKKLYQKLYQNGARAVLLRFETSNRKIFQKLRPGTNFEERIDLIKFVKKIGYLLATGFLIGLPGETKNDIINNILLTKSLNTDMYSFGPFIPARGTPLENLKPVNLDTVLKIISISRIVDRKAKILVTSALETLDKEARRKGLLAGANSLMINLTPQPYKNLYELYPNRPDRFKSLKNYIEETINLLYSLGRAPTDLGI